MTPRIESVSLVRDFVVRVRFRDGAERQVDLADELEGALPFGTWQYSVRFGCIRNSTP